ncbi:hypothetical protein J6590_069922, partial [Homalodisca vitripennis]
EETSTTLILNMVDGISSQSTEPYYRKREILMPDENYVTSYQQNSKTSLDKDCKNTLRNGFSRDLPTPCRN